MTTATPRKSGLVSVERTAEQLHLGLQDLADIVGVDQSTLYRWRRGLSTPRAMVAVRLIQVAELFDLLKRLFAGPDPARTWLHEATPVSVGGKATPMDIMRTGRIDRVLLVLHSLAAGAS